jgi:hypothetical protein
MEFKRPVDALEDYVLPFCAQTTDLAPLFLHFFMGEVVRNEGELHNGLSHVIQFVGQKPSLEIR